MKKIMISVLLIFVLATSMCSAATVRVCDYGLNDFVDFYSRVADRIYEGDKAYNIKFNERPFKNLNMSDANYKVYTCTAGKGKDNMMTVHFFIDKSGYVNKISVFGNSKREKQKELFVYVIGVCLMSCGVDANTILEWVNSSASNLFIFNEKGFFKLQEKNRRIYIESKSAEISAAQKQEPRVVWLYGESI